MSNISLFFRYGLSDIWKEKTIWLFVALSLAQGLFNIPLTEKNLWWLWGILSVIGLVFYFACNIGVPFITYCVFIGEPVTIPKTFQAVRKSFKRIVTLFLGAVILVIPCICSTSFFSLNQPLQPSYISQHPFWILWPWYFFTAFFYFSIAEIVIKDFGIRKSVKNAWRLFSSHLKDAVLMGIIVVTVGWLTNTFIGMLIMLIQSGFDTTSLNTIDYINPALSFSGNIFYYSATAISSAMLSTYTTIIFVFAYLKYNGITATRKSSSG